MARTTTHGVLDSYDPAIDEIIARCNGDLPGAIKALLLVNEQLESRLSRFYEAAIYGAPIEPRTKSSRP